MLRHARWFKDADGVRKHMADMADFNRPKFDLIISALNREIAPTGTADWTNPDGGFFISLNTPDNCAKRTVELCAEAGLIVTAAGAAYPNGDPRGRNIRIAPTYPSMNELCEAMKVFCASLKLAALEREFYAV
jgi:DNA-binding transcriptional MocR family regulator